MNQTEMAAHDKTTWELYIEANHAGAKRMSAQVHYDRLLKHLDSKVAYERGNAERGIDAALDHLNTAMAVEQAASDNLNAHEKAYTGWARFWAVPNGHIHSSRNCSTCNNGERGTEFYLMYEVSGMDAEAAVEAKGAFICSVCFPNAPVEYTNGYELAAAAKKAAQCGGTYSYEEAKKNGYRRYQRCTTCDTMQSITSTGKMRAHKAK